MYTKVGFYLINPGCYLQHVGLQNLCIDIKKPSKTGLKKNIDISNLSNNANPKTLGVYK